VALGIFVSAVIFSSDVGKGWFGWTVARRGYEVMDSLIRAYMRAGGSIAWVSLGVAIVSFMPYMIARSKKTRWR
jgi:hypothetical protein